MTETPVSRFRSLLRWALPTLLAVLLLPSWILFFSGGMLAVYGWLALVNIGSTINGRIHRIALSTSPKDCHSIFATTTEQPCRRVVSKSAMERSL